MLRLNLEFDKEENRTFSGMQNYFLLISTPTNTKQEIYSSSEQEMWIMLTWKCLEPYYTGAVGNPVTTETDASKVSCQFQAPSGSPHIIFG